MRAIQMSEYGGPEVLELVELPVPEPRDGEVLIRVSRAGLNFADTHRRTNTYLAKDELPLVPGSEVAGVHVLVVDAAPEERLAARDVLDVVGDDAALVQDRVVRRTEVVAHGTDDANLVEERRAEREVDGGAAEHALAAAVRRPHCIERD